MYSPVLNRFQSRDPLPQEGEPDVLYGEKWVNAHLARWQNSYCYALNSPVNLVDPSGLQAKQTLIALEQEGDAVLRRPLQVSDLVNVGIDHPCTALAKAKKYCRYDLVSVKIHNPKYPCKFTAADLFPGTILCKGECSSLTSWKCPSKLVHRDLDENREIQCEAVGEYLDCAACE